MLDYAKTILKKVSFSKELFIKEYEKFLNWLQPGEREELYQWCNIYYSDQIGFIGKSYT